GASGTEQVLPGDAANGDRARGGDSGRTAAVAEGQVWCFGGLMREGLDVVVLERFGGEGGDAAGNLGQRLLALARRDGDGRNFAAALGRARPLLGTGGR